MRRKRKKEKMGELFESRDNNLHFVNSLFSFNTLSLFLSALLLALESAVESFDFA